MSRGLFIMALSLGACATPLHGDAKRDADARWEGDPMSDADARWEGDSTTTALDLVWEDADGAFQVDGGGFRRTGNEPSQSSNRHFMRTVQSNFALTDWTCQITFHTPANAPDDIIFIGLGEAVPDSSFFNEPRNSLNFRIHQGATAFGTGWDVDVMAHDIGNFHWTYTNQGVGSLPGATGGAFTAWIRKAGNQVTFEILSTAIVATIPKIATAAPFLFTSPSRLFFGNASGAYTFDGPLLIAGQYEQPTHVHLSWHRRQRLVRRCERRQDSSSVSLI